VRHLEILNEKCQYRERAQSWSDPKTGEFEFESIVKRFFGSPGNRVDSRSVRNLFKLLCAYKKHAGA